MNHDDDDDDVNDTKAMSAIWYNYYNENRKKK